MLSGSVHTLERLLVEQYLEPMFLGDPLHEGHDHQVVIDGQVHLLIDRGKLELVGRDLVVPRLDRDTELVCLVLEILHECQYPHGDCSEIVIVELLALGRGMTHESPFRHHEVWALCIQLPVNEEIFLFPTEVGDTSGELLSKEREDGC